MEAANVWCIFNLFFSSYIVACIFLHLFWRVKDHLILLLLISLWVYDLPSQSTQTKKERHGNIVCDALQGDMVTVCHTLWGDMVTVCHTLWGDMVTVCHAQWGDMIIQCHTLWGDMVTQCVTHYGEIWQHSMSRTTMRYGNTVCHALLGDMMAQCVTHYLEIW